MMRGKYKIFYALQTLLLFLISSSLALAQGKIAFSRPNPVTGWTDIYIGDVDAEKGKIYNIRNFTNFMAHDFYPTWSPDGSKIAFVSDRSGKGHAIYIADYKGENIRLLLPQDMIGNIRGEPGWSPDGSKIAFSAMPKGTHNYGLYIIDADGKNLRKVKVSGFLDSNNCRWSPDGSKIATHAGEIYVVDLKTGISKLIAAGEGIDWSERGLLYARTLNHGIFIYDVDKNILEAYPLPDFDFIDDPSYSPDSSKVLFVGKKGGKESFYILDLETRKVKDLGIWGQWPDWGRNYPPQGLRSLNLLNTLWSLIKRGEIK
ncbi:MAG TPA: hypothetical protein ENG09_01390 [Candidatus Syntrophoarchaeum butanivorans]|uniref:Uncharacterized protein n=1 Tax=Candidatus Syntropharchaeum butanivorans TaxID=1839936 RepID=A0A7C0X294_9EURY|nr:hypothetical protein [Candidatus Syntrophoarchaeum butanivorans]